MPDKSYPDQRFKFSSDTYETYKSLLDIAVAQAEQNISNIHELIIHQRTADNDQDMFKKHMLELEELYKSGDHNVLSIGNDVIFFEPVNPFDSKYTTFTLSGLNADVKYSSSFIFLPHKVIDKFSFSKPAVKFRVSCFL